jgi:hypothetical protein
MPGGERRGRRVNTARIAARARIVAAMAFLRDPGPGRPPGRAGHHQPSSLTRCETIGLWTALRSAKLAEFGCLS